MTQTPLVSVVVPVYNSSENLAKLVNSLVASTYSKLEIIVNDDLRSTDDTELMLQKFSDKINIRYLRKNLSMAQGRAVASEYANGEILIHLDSDMSIEPLLIEECVNNIASSYDALVIPEQSIGTTFWARCKALEKTMYNNVAEIESLRCIKKSTYDAVNGHDAAMIFSEDKDLDIRVRESGAKVGRTKSKIFHDEGNLKLMKTLKKKLNYSHTANLFKDKHPKEYSWQSNPLNRYMIFIKNGRLSIKHPLIYIGLWYMKTFEYAAAALGIIQYKRRQKTGTK